MTHLHLKCGDVTPIGDFARQTLVKIAESPIEIPKGKYRVSWRFRLEMIWGDDFPTDAFEAFFDDLLDSCEPQPTVWQRNHRDRANASQKKWREAHREHYTIYIREYMRKYYKTPTGKERVDAAQKKYRDKKRKERSE